MVNRIVSVDEAFAFPPEVRAALLDLLGAGSPGRPLALVNHNPTTQAEYSNPAGASFAGLAPAALAVTFAAPSTGNVIVDLEGHVNVCDQRGYWGVLNGPTLLASAMVCGAVGEATGLRGRARLPVSGLTAGQSYTLAWASASASGAFTLRVGGAGGLGSARSGPATITVWAAP